MRGYAYARMHTSAHAFTDQGPLQRAPSGRPHTLPPQIFCVSHAHVQVGSWPLALQGPAAAAQRAAKGTPGFGASAGSSAPGGGAGGSGAADTRERRVLSQHQAAVAKLISDLAARQDDVSGAGGGVEGARCSGHGLGARNDDCTLEDGLRIDAALGHVAGRAGHAEQRWYRPRT